MEIGRHHRASETTYKGRLNSYWKRRGYRRLGGGGRTRQESGGGEGCVDQPTCRRRRPFWRIKLRPRLRFLRKLSPLRLLARLRDAYVRAMLSLAHSPSFGYGYYGGGAGVAGFGRPAPREYEERAIVEIYKSILAQGSLAVAASAAATASAGRVSGGSSKIRVIT